MRWIWGRLAFGLRYVAALGAVVLLMALFAAVIGAAIVGTAWLMKWLGGF